MGPRERELENKSAVVSPLRSLGWKSVEELRGTCAWTGDDARLRVKGILLSLLALELFGYCTAVLSAFDVVVDNVKK